MHGLRLDSLRSEEPAPWWLTVPCRSDEEGLRRLAAFDLITPKSRSELAAVASSGRLLSGGTDLLVRLRGDGGESRLIDVSNLQDGPPVLSDDGASVEISAFASISSVVGALQGRLPALAAAAAVFASTQIRNRATIGGNIANASPAADMVPPLLVADAVATIEGSQGPRRLPIGEIATGPGKVCLAQGEWISTIRAVFPRDADEGFLKLGGRSAMNISIVNLAWRWRRTEDGALDGVRLALGSVAPTVVRAPRAESVLEGRVPNDDVVEEAMRALGSDIRPIDDVRASAWYRAEMATELLREALQT